MATVLFVSLISRQDTPLYIQSFDIKSDQESREALSAEDANKFLKYNFLSHMALDVFASPMSLHLREEQGNEDGILLLFIQDGATVYGMETNNGLKLVVGLSEEVPFRSAMKSLFSQIHKCYLRTYCNPFTDLSSSEDTENMLQTPTFDNRIRAIISGWK